MSLHFVKLKAARMLRDAASVLKTKKTKLDKVVGKKAKAEAKKDKKKEVPDTKALNNAKAELKKQIAAEKKARDMWTSRRAVLTEARKQRKRDLGRLKKAFAHAEEAAVTASAMAVSVSRYAAQDKLTAAHDLNKAKNATTTNIKVHTAALMAPIHRLESMFRDATEQWKEAKAAAKAARLYNANIEAMTKRRISDIKLAAASVRKQMRAKFVNKTDVEQSRKAEDMVVQQKIALVKKDEVKRLHTHEESIAIQRVQAAKRHQLNIHKRMELRHQELLNLEKKARVDSENNQKTADQTNKMADAARKQAFKSATDAAKAVKKARKKLKAGKPRWKKAVAAAKKSVAIAKKVHDAHVKKVAAARKLADKALAALGNLEKKDAVELRKDDKKAKVAETDTIGQRADAAKKLANRQVKIPQMKWRAAVFQLKERKKSLAREKERIWQLDQAVANAELVKNLLPHQIAEAKRNKAEAEQKLSQITHAESKAANALVGAKRSESGYAKKADKLIHSETMASMALRNVTQTRQANRVKVATYIRKLVRGNQRLRRNQAHVLKRLTALKLAEAKQKQANLQTQIERVVVLARKKKVRVQGLLAQADTARASAEAAALKADAMESQSATRAAKLAVARYAAQSLKRRGKDYQVLSKQASDKVQAAMTQVAHSKVEEKAVQVLLTAGQSPKEKARLKTRLGETQRAAKSAEAKRLTYAERAKRTAAVAARAQEKASWMSKRVIVKRLQYLAAVRWAAMATRESARQWKVMRRAEKSAKNAGLAVAHMQVEADGLKSKSAKLSIDAKVSILTEALKEAKASRTIVQTSLAKRKSVAKKALKSFYAALKLARDRNKQAAAMFKMGEAVRTAQYKAKSGKQERADDTSALKWEKQSAAAQMEAAKADIEMSRQRMKMESIMQSTKVAATLLAQLAQQEFRVHSKLLDAKLTQAAAGLQSKQRAIRVMQKFRAEWTKRFVATQLHEAKASGLARTQAGQATRSAVISRGEVRIAQMTVRSANHKLAKARAAHMKALDAVEHVRFKLEVVRREERHLRLEARRGSLKGAAKAKLDAKIKKAHTARVAAALLEQQATRKLLALNKLELQARDELDRRSEKVIYSQEIARAADRKESMGRSRTIVAEAAYNEATQALEKYKELTEAAALRDHDIKSKIYKVMLSNKEGMSKARAAWAAVRQIGADAVKNVALKMLDIERRRADHTAQRFKIIRKQEHQMRNKSRMAQKHAKVLRSAGAKSKALQKAEKQAADAAQLAEFAHARKKVEASKGKVTVAKMEQIEANLTKDDKKMAISKAIQAAAAHQRRKMKMEEDESLAAATRFILAAKALRAEFPHFAAKLKARNAQMAKARAAAGIATEHAADADKMAKLAAEELHGTHAARIAGKKHWQRLRACALVSHNAAKRASLRTRIKKAAAATQDYQSRAAKFKHIAHAQKQLASTARNNAAASARKVRSMQQEEHEAARRAQEAEQQQDIRKVEQHSWAEQEQNTMQYAEKALMRGRAAKASKELGEAVKSAQAARVKEANLALVLHNMRKTQRTWTRKEIRHHARSTTALEDYRTLRSKAKQESAHGEKLQVDLDHVSVPTPMKQAECDAQAGTGPKVSKAWRRSTLKNLVAYYVAKKAKKKKSKKTSLRM
jgi:hypothetical protein